jgi:hypothetical protein
MTRGRARERRSIAAAVATARRAGLVTSRMPGVTRSARSAARLSRCRRTVGVERGRSGRSTGRLSTLSARGDEKVVTRPADGCLVERRHPVAAALCRGVEQPDRERRTSPLAQPEVELEQRPEPEPVEHHGMARLD